MGTSADTTEASAGMCFDLFMDSLFIALPFWWTLGHTAKMLLRPLGAHNVVIMKQLKTEKSRNRPENSYISHNNCPNYIAQDRPRLQCLLGRA